MAEAIIEVIGECFAYLIGKILGKTGVIDQEKAMVIGEYVVIGLVVTAAIAVTIVYS